VLLGVLALATAPAAPAAGQGNATTQETGSPINDQGSSYHYRTYITSITPHAPGLSIEVLEFADRLLLRNHTGKTVTIYGYSGEPYARVLAGGATEQNKRSPAVYLNTNFYAQVTVPPSADASATPAWETVDRTAQFEWHDHRIHWMSPATPPQVKDTSKRTKIFDWSVPIRVGDQPGAIRGELFWVPNSSSAPTGLIAGSIVLAAIAIAAAVLMRRGRRVRPAAENGSEDGPEREAW
jgi:hypothetical protein